MSSKKSADGTSEGVSEASSEAPVASAAVIPECAAGHPGMSLKEFCVGKPVTFLWGMAAIYGDPRYATKTRAEWMQAERDFWNKKA